MHLIPVPGDVGGLRAALGKAHRRYTRQVNFREGWRGYLRQGRSASVAMDESYPLAAAYYAELNPVRARLVERAGDWRWSSARAHLDGRDDALVRGRTAARAGPRLAGVSAPCRSTSSMGFGSTWSARPRHQPISRTPALAAFRASSAGRPRILSHADGAGGGHQDREA